MLDEIEARGGPNGVREVMLVLMMPVIELGETSAGAVISASLRTCRLRSEDAARRAQQPLELAMSPASTI